MSANNELVVDVVEVKAQQQEIKEDKKQPQTERKSRNPFKRKKKQEEEKKDSEEIPDEREPNLTFKDGFTIYKIIGWNWILVFLGSIGAMGTGVIPIRYVIILTFRLLILLNLIVSNLLWEI